MTTATPSTRPSTPVVVSPLARRYAAALYQAAAQGQALPAVQAAVSGLRSALSGGELAAELASPRFTVAQRTQLADALSGLTGKQTVLNGFFHTLAANGRLDQLVPVLHAFDEQVDAAAGRLRARVETAAPFTDAQRKQLQDAIRQWSGAQDVVLEETAEPNLLGGFRAFFGGKVWDASVQGGLSRLTQSLRGGQG